MRKQRNEVRLLDKELNKHENFGFHSPSFGIYDVDTSSFAGPKYTISKSKKFLQLKHKTDLDKNLPISYMKNSNFTSGSVKNYSVSNLPKQDRFRFRDVAEREMSDLAGPANYNLSEAFSINK
jgi:hypothetical protein